MFNQVKPQYWNCMGETVLKKTKFDEDTANQRTLNRFENDLRDQQLRQLIQTPAPNIFPTSQPQFVLPPAQLPLPARIMQSVAAFFTQPFVAMAALVQNTAQGAQQMLSNLAKNMEAAATQILTFFFGHKKDKTEEKEKRDQDDLMHSDLFSDTKVAKGDKPQMSGGGGK